MYAVAETKLSARSCSQAWPTFVLDISLRYYSVDLHNFEPLFWFALVNLCVRGIFFYLIYFYCLASYKRPWPHLTGCSLACHQMFLVFCYFRLGIKACAVLIPLLGITWLFGLLSPLHKAFAYIFTILNSAQVCTESWIQQRLRLLLIFYEEN